MRRKKKNRVYQEPKVDWASHEVNGVTEQEAEEYAKRGIEVRPWGFFQDLSHTSNWHIKTIHIQKDAILSLQAHKKREEHWMVVEGVIIAEVWWRNNKKEETILKVGDKFLVPVEHKHRVSSYKGDAVIVEISLGEFDENDIKRYSDKYGRK